MTQSDKWRKRRVVEKYHAFKDLVRLHDVELPERNYGVIFYLPMPKSWSKRKKEKYNLTPHQSRPDLSNLIKALEDACWADDAIIWHYGRLTKVWAYEGSIAVGGPADVARTQLSVARR